ncbi:hypothetical protein OJ253_1529 [Cryptosporidium canis]|uniref:Phospholipase/carboxylesterase/thioesterase domain-containing protein n=1 Tax=Cryptosporidium canis TaxID=195482 RepID=A0A9D5HXW0_9CRYT|nr:hypothetical protein OJ253_1529 [Cryptosporidium canis]
MSSEKKGILFCLGCISVIPGMKNQLVNSMSFHPPAVKGYRYSKRGDSVMVFDFHRKRYVSLNEMKRSLAVVDPGRCQIQVKFASIQSVDFFHYINPAAKLTIIYSHSNATDIGYLFGHLLDFSHKAQVNIISYEYNGYGQLLKKKTSEESLYENIKTIVHYSINTLKIPPSTLILYGQSIGSAPTIHFASTYSSVNIGGIIIHSGIKSAVSVICNTNNSKSLPWYDAFKNLEKIQRVKCPVFVIHGTADTTIPFHHGEMLYKLSPNKYTPWYVNGANHCNIELSWRGELIAKVRQFIEYVSPTQKSVTSKPHIQQDYASVSRISTLSSQGFENLYNDLENEDDYNYDDCEDVYGGSLEHEPATDNCSSQASTHYREFNALTMPTSKYFTSQVAKIDEMMLNANPSNSKHPIQARGACPRGLNSASQSPSGIRNSDNRVIYGVSIYESDHPITR